VKPARFDYYDPTTLAEALSLLAQFSDTAKQRRGLSRADDEHAAGAGRRN
jgi:hypothetical protein